MRMMSTRSRRDPREKQFAARLAAGDALVAWYLIGLEARHGKTANARAGAWMRKYPAWRRAKKAAAAAAMEG